MHDRTEVIAADVVTVGNVLSEVVLLGVGNVREIDRDHRIAVLPALLMPQTKGMAHFVNHRSDGGSVGQLDVLAATSFTHLRAAGSAWHEANEVSVVGGAGNKTHPGVGRPVRHSIGNALWIRQIRVHLEWHPGIGPTESPAGDSDPFRTRFGVDLLKRAQHYVALEYGKAVNL